MPLQQPRLSDEKIRERANDARSLINTPVFGAAMAAVIDDAQNTLIQAPVGTSQAMDAHAILRAVDQIRLKLSNWSIQDRAR